MTPHETAREHVANALQLLAGGCSDLRVLCAVEARLRSALAKLDAESAIPRPDYFAFAAEGARRLAGGARDEVGMTPTLEES